MKAYSNYLIPLFNATVIFDLHAISEDITQIPEEILPLFRINGQTDENGLVKIGNITFDSGISSVYYVRPLVVYSFGVDLSNQNLSTALSNIIDMILDPNLRSSLSLSTYDEFMDGLLSLQDLGLIDFWFGDMISFTLVSQVGSILLLNQTQNSSLRYGLNTTYFFKVRVYSMDSLPLIQTSVNLDFFLIHFPSYLVNDYVSKNSSEFKKTLIDFKQLSAKTDVKGEILFT